MQNMQKLKDMLALAIADNRPRLVAARKGHALVVDMLWPRTAAATTAA